ncbi:MAG: ribonuclease domain-containing protein [Burkholderiaceae bacterium]
MNPNRLLAVLCLVLAVIASACSPRVESRDLLDPGVVALAALPPEARQVHALILRGGPFPYARDGTTFFNRERLLPAKPRGHYKEYTVPTPGARDRGARRIVVGGNPRTDAVFWYTDDHYRSSRRIRE